jgi:phosphatidylinositol alpha-1,6-mannosyltransferase
MSASIRRRLAVVIVGRGAEPYENQLRALAAESPLKVVFTGGIARDELRSWYRNADVFCLPGTDEGSGVEGFGLVYLEAAAQGLPAVACAVHAIPEVVRHGETGLLSPPADAAALAASLTSVLEDEPARHRLGVNAREWAGTFTWERCARLTYGSSGSDASTRGPSS